ncbi:hypothetical protein Anas_11175 [Armadillidium nasatum]|uniref:Uncharacterized protein n=1 Tax=Armadillidium nasatum TaxID=96803 RepID=A0A5N5SRL5_9CRUS|nr:hypothetical protein Anas_11175 [Armadillidium nasatum]
MQNIKEIFNNNYTLKRINYVYALSYFLRDFACTVFLCAHLCECEKEFSFTCSEEVTNLGFHQKVISYSFLNTSKRYWIGFNELMQNISVFYPGWRVRVYASSPDISFLQSIMKNWTFVNFCDIDNLPPPIYSVRFYPVTMWRFAPLGDDQVDVMLSRDLDSEILKREYDAVSEWLNSTNKSLHIMRDHQLHCVTMLGGTWGIRVTKPSERRRLRIIRQKMFKSAFNKTEETRDDQTYLTYFISQNMLLIFCGFKYDIYFIQIILWPEFNTDFIAHDSYCCDRRKGSSPFPTRREDGKYVGASIFGSNNPSGVYKHMEMSTKL